MNKETRNFGSTTTSLQAIVMVTATYPLGKRYSLNYMETYRDGMKMPVRLQSTVGHKVTACRFTIDHFGIDLIDKIACAQMEVANPFSTTTDLTPATAVTSWNAGITSGQEWVNKQAHYKVAQLLEHPYILN